MTAQAHMLRCQFRTAKALCERMSITRGNASHTRIPYCSTWKMYLSGMISLGTDPCAVLYVAITMSLGIGGEWRTLWTPLDSLPETAKSCSELISCRWKKGCGSRSKCIKAALIHAHDSVIVRENASTEVKHVEQLPWTVSRVGILNIHIWCSNIHALTILLI